MQKKQSNHYEDVRRFKKGIKYNLQKSGVYQRCSQEAAEKILKKTPSHLQQIRNETMLKESPENRVVLNNLIDFYNRKIEEGLKALTAL